MTWNTNVGHQIANCHFLDLRYIPKGTTLTYEFNLSITTYDLNIDEQIFTRYFFFVDESGQVIDRKLHYFDPVTNGNGSYTWSENIDVSTFPSGAVGLVPMFVVRNLESAFSDVMVYLSSFELVIPMSALEFNNSQNQKLQTTINNVQSAIEEQNKKFDEITNSKVDPALPPGSDTTDELHKQEQELQGSAQDGLNQGEQTLTDALKILNGYLSAFHVVKFIFAEFANIPFFVGLITISLAIGLVATLLGMALEFKSFSVAEEKRKNAAAEKARRDHDRAEYRRRMLERSKQN